MLMQEHWLYIHFSNNVGSKAWVKNSYINQNYCGVTNCKIRPQS